MIRAFQLLAMATIGIALASVASAGPTYTTVDFPGAIATILAGGPNPQGESVGFYYDQAFVPHGFSYEKGAFTTIDPPGSTGTFANWISPQGTIVGQYLDSSGVGHGFILAGGTYTTLDYPGAAGTGLTTNTPSGELAGFYCVTLSNCNNFLYSGFVMSKKGVFTSIDYPGATSTAVALNPSGQIACTYATTSAGLNGPTHGCVPNKDGTLTTLDYPGSTSTFIGAISPTGAIVGAETDASGNVHGFLLSRGVFTSFDYPGPPGAVTLTDAAGISPTGVIVGQYYDSAFFAHGFIRTP